MLGFINNSLSYNCMVAVSSNKLYFWKWLSTRDVLILSFSAHTRFVCASRTPICLGFSQLVFYIFYLNNLIIETCLKTGPMRAQEFNSEGWQSAGKKIKPMFNPSSRQVCKLTELNPSSREVCKLGELNFSSGEVCKLSELNPSSREVCKLSESQFA